MRLRTLDQVQLKVASSNVNWKGPLNNPKSKSMTTCWKTTSTSSNKRCGVRTTWRQMRINLQSLCLWRNLTATIFKWLKQAYACLAQLICSTRSWLTNSLPLPQPVSTECQICTGSLSNNKRAFKKKITQFHRVKTLDAHLSRNQSTRTLNITSTRHWRTYPWHDSVWKLNNSKMIIKRIYSSVKFFKIIRLSRGKVRQRIPTVARRIHRGLIWVLRYASQAIARLQTFRPRST